MKIRLVVSGRSYDAAGSLPRELDLPAGATVADAVASAARLLGEGKSFSPSCLVAVSGKHLGSLSRHAEHVLADGDELVLIAPVAGG